MSPSSSLVRLDQLLVSRGWGSRKDVVRLIRKGHIRNQIEVLRSPKLKVKSHVKLWVKDELSLPLPTVIMYHKPLHILSTYRDPWGRSGLDTVLPLKWRTQFHPVGRLDADTTGLLLFSRDGQLTHHLLHPKKEVPRTYQAHVQKVPPNLIQMIKEGIQTSLGTFNGHIQQIENKTVTLTVHEGKHRMVRRMLHNAGASVLELHRLSFGGVPLGDLEVGEYRSLTEHEEMQLYTLTS